MEENVTILLKLILDSIWRLATSWKLPGISVTPASAIMFVLILATIWDLLSAVLNTSILPFNEKSEKEK